MSMWVYDGMVWPITARDADRDYANSDAGTAPYTGEDFIVQADTREEALDGAKLWLKSAADESDPAMPDGLYLEERSCRRGSYMTLRVV